MRRKLLIALLTASMALSPAMAVSAAEFTDGSTAAGIQGNLSTPQSAGQDAAVDTDLFTDDSSVAGEDFADSSIQGTQLFSDTAVENGTYAAQSTYQISVSGELILSETQKFVDLLNAERAKLGVHPLVLDQKCMDISKERAIQGSVVYGHVMPNGQSYVNVYGMISECAAGSFYGTAEDLLNTWKNSPSHWNILTSDAYTRFGFSIYHHKGIDNYFYGYANLIRDEVDDNIVSYTGPLADQQINGFTMSVMSKGLLMKSETSTMKVGEILTLSPKFDVYDGQHGGAQQDTYEYGDGYLDDNCGTWDSSNSSVATVDSNGNVKALKEGTAVIRFFVNGDRDKYYQNTISVGSTVSGSDLGWYKDPYSGRTWYYNYETGEQIGGWITLDGKQYHCVTYSEYLKHTYQTADGTEIEPTQGRIENLTVAIDGVWYKFDQNGVATKLDKAPDNPGQETPENPGGDTPEDPGQETPEDPGQEKPENPDDEPDAPETNITAPALKGACKNYQYASFTWNKVANADGYEVYGYNSGKKTWTKIADGTKTAYQRKIGYGKTGKFRIRAYAVENGKKTYGDYSNIVTIKTAALAPKITSVKATGSRTLTVNWQKSASAEGYMIYRYIKKNGNYNLVKTINSGDVQSFKNTGLVKGRTYWYKIKSFRLNENGKKITGVYSAPVSAKCR